MNEDDLSTVTNEQLMDELGRRADAMVLCFQPRANEESVYYTRCVGHILLRTGMIRKLKLETDKDLMGS